jgi:hypothetical protein
MIRTSATTLASAALLAAALVLTGAPGTASAQDMALDGTWKSVEGRQGARAGDSEHDLGEGDTFTTTQSEETWTLTIDESRDRAVHGEWCSPNKCEDLVGVQSVTGQFYAVDEDGMFIGTVLGDRMELCYLEHGSDFKVADCHMMGRQ